MRLSRLFPLLIFALLLAACGGGVELKGCQDTAGLFMERMASGDVRGAYDLCDPDALNYDGLRAIAENPQNKDVLGNYQGIEFGDGGQKTQKDDITEVRLAPATPKGHTDYVVHFAFRKKQGHWRIIGFQLAHK